MIQRIFVILVAFQLVLTSAFAHAMPMPEHCAAPVAEHRHGEAVSLLQDQVVDVAVTTDRQSQPLGLLHCASAGCADQIGNAYIVDVHRGFRVADLKPAEPPVALQSVLLLHLRPPMV